jgi:fibrillarin-like rRNA methylase
MEQSPLLQYRNNLYSQNGEDGIIRELINRLQIKEPNWVCEFGAWDGKHLSNTFALVERGWNAVYIEGDPEKFSDLLVTANKCKNIVPINEFVPRSGGGAGFNSSANTNSIRILDFID